MAQSWLHFLLTLAIANAFREISAQPTALVTTLVEPCALDTPLVNDTVVSIRCSGDILSPIHIEHTKILGVVWLESKTLHEVVRVSERTVFNGQVQWNQVRFLKEVWIGYSNFHSISSFAGNVYQAPFTCQADTFSSSALFNGSTFMAPLVVSNSIFQSKCDFFDCSFSESASFQGSQFNGILDLSRCRFKGTLVLRKVKAHGFRLMHVELPDTVDLSEATSSGMPISLTAENLARHNSDRKNPILINLLGTNLDALDIDYTYFELYFPDSTSDKSRRELYHDLILHFQETGDKKSEQKITGEFEHYKHPFFSWIGWITTGHGFAKERALVVILFILFCTCLIRFIHYDALDSEHSMSARLPSTTNIERWRVAVLDATFDLIPIRTRKVRRPKSLWWHQYLRIVRLLGIGLVSLFIAWIVDLLGYTGVPGS